MKTLKLTDATVCAVDVETTGLTPHHERIVEIGAVEFSPSSALPALQHFHSLVNPGKRHLKKADKRALKVHRINKKSLKDAPLAEEVLPDFLEFLQGADFGVAHNAGFDSRFLSMELARAGLKAPKILVLDTLEMARYLMPRLHSFKQENLIKHFRVKTGRAHLALNDCLALVQVFKAMLAENPEIETLDDLLDITGTYTLNLPVKFRT